MRSRAVTVWSILVVIAGVVVLTTGPLYRVRTWWSYDDPLDTDPGVLTVRGAIAIVGVAALLTGARWRRIDRASGAFAVALLSWLLLSTVWSLDSAETARQALLVAGTMAAGAAAATVLSPTPLLWSLWAGVQLGLGWSAVAIWRVAPGTQDLGGEWAGIFFNRNSLALIAAIGLVVSGLLLTGLPEQARSSRRRWSLVIVLVGAAGVDLVLLVGTDSLTPLLAVAAVAVAIAAAVTARRWRRRGARTGPLVAAAGLIAVTIGALGWLLREPLADAVGRDADFSGRAALWDVSWAWFADRPLLGWGYRAAWTDDAFLADVLAARGEVLTSAHNSFVEVLLGGGVLAAGLVLGLFGATYWHVARRAVDSDRLEMLWPLALFAFVLIEQLSETLLVGGQLTVAMLGSLLVNWTSSPARRSARRATGSAPAETAGSAGVPQPPLEAAPAARDRR